MLNRRGEGLPRLPVQPPNCTVSSCTISALLCAGSLLFSAQEQQWLCFQNINWICHIYAPNSQGLNLWKKVRLLWRLGSKEPACIAGAAGDAGLIPGLRRSPREGNGYPLQYSCLENPMDWGAWHATVPGVPKSQTQLKQLSTDACMDKGHNPKTAWGALPPLPTAPARPHLTLLGCAPTSLSQNRPPSCLPCAVTTLTTGPLHMQFLLSPQTPACLLPLSSSVTPTEEPFKLYLWDGPG